MFYYTCLLACEYFLSLSSSETTKVEEKRRKVLAPFKNDKGKSYIDSEYFLSLSSSETTKVEEKRGKHKSKVLAPFKNDKGKSYIDFSSETTKVGEIRLVSFVRKVS